MREPATHVNPQPASTLTNMAATKRNDVELTDEQRRDAAAAATAHQRRVTKASLVATSVPRELVGSLAAGVANMMLVEILVGDLKPKTVREAADAAKVALEIARLEAGEGNPAPADMTAEQRAAKLAEARDALERVRAGAGELADLDPHDVARAGADMLTERPLAVVRDINAPTT